MDSELKVLVKDINKRQQQRVCNVKQKYEQNIYRLKNYLDVLKRIKNYGKPETHTQQLLIYEVSKIKDWIDQQIEDIDHLIRLLEKLQNFDFKNKSLDEVYRCDVGISTDRFRRLIINGSVLTPEEKKKIILFIHS